jgi:hypothetical protein
MLGITYRDEQTCAKQFEPRITPNISVFLGVTTMGPCARRSYCYAPYLVSVPLCRQLSDGLNF